MLSFDTVFPTQLIGVKIAIVIRDERREITIRSLKFYEDDRGHRVRISVEEGDWPYFVSASEPFDVLAGKK